MKHTPTPWSEVWAQYIIPANHQDRKIGGSTNSKQDREEFAHVICKMERNRNHFTADEATANAEFIVRACNSHNQLVESVKALLGCMSLAGWEDDYVAVQARAALASAERESK